jgi:hypothetical protein
LSHYDATVCKKKYLGYSEREWERFCANEVQYINRMQRGEWLDLFQSAGFQVIEEESRRVDISAIKVAPRYASMRTEDLASTVVRLVLKKPAVGT